MSILKTALASAPKTAPKIESAPRDNSARDKNFAEFLQNFDELKFQEIPKHAQLKLEKFANTIFNFLENSTLIQNGELKRPASGFESLNFAIAQLIYNELKKSTPAFFNYAGHDREVAQNKPLKTLINTDMSTAQKFQLIQEILENLQGGDNE